MNKEQYIRALKSKLTNLPQEEIDNAVDYVSEYYDECQDDEKAYQELGDPSKFAAQIKADFAIKQNEIQAYKISNQGKEKLRANNDIKTILVIILGILSLPISLPLALVVVALLFVLMVLLFVPFVVLIALVFALGTVIVSSILALFTSSVSAPAWFILCTVFFSLALLFLCIALILLVGSKFIPWLIIQLGDLFTKLKERFKKKGEENHEETH